METKIEQFAKDHMGLTLTKYQLEIIKAVSEGKAVIMYTPPRSGKTTAYNVMRAYLADAVEPIKPTATITIHTPPREPQPPRYIFIDDNLRTRG